MGVVLAMRNTFTDSTLQKQFEDKGYVIIKKFLLEDDCKRAIAFYNETKHDANVELNFYTSIWSDNVNYRKNVNDFLSKLIYPKTLNLLSNHSPLFANYMVKKSRLDIL